MSMTPTPHQPDLDMAELRRDIEDGLDVKASVATALLDRLERAECALRPYIWTEAMDAAWHKTIPDMYGAFAALREAAGLPRAQAAAGAVPEGMRNVGAQLANVAFNWSQHTRTLTEADCALLKNLQIKWDAAIAAAPPSQGLPAAPETNPTALEIRAVATPPAAAPSECRSSGNAQVMQEQEETAGGAGAAAPSEPTLEGVKLNVIARSYGFELSSDGEIHGLTAGDQGYEQTGIKLEGRGLEMWKAAWEKSAAGNNPVAWRQSSWGGLAWRYTDDMPPTEELAWEPLYIATPPAQDAGTGELEQIRAAVAKMAQGYAYGAGYYNEESFVEGLCEIFKLCGHEVME